MRSSTLRRIPPSSVGATLSQDSGLDLFDERSRDLFGMIDAFDQERFGKILSSILRHGQLSSWQELISFVDPSPHHLHSNVCRVLWYSETR